MKTLALDIPERSVGFCENSQKPMEKRFETRVSTSIVPEKYDFLCQCPPIGWHNQDRASLLAWRTANSEAI